VQALGGQFDRRLVAPGAQKTRSTRVFRQHKPAQLVPPGNPASLVAVLRDALAPGSYLVISHGTTDAQAPNVTDAMDHYDQTAAPFRPRGYPDVLRFFGGYDLIEPGLVHVPLWRPDTPEEAAQAAAYGGVGRKQ
jgi:S-adenosyl methyltransferase